MAPASLTLTRLHIDTPPASLCVHPVNTHLRTHPFLCLSMCLPAPPHTKTNHHKNNPQHTDDQGCPDGAVRGAPAVQQWNKVQKDQAHLVEPLQRTLTLLC